MFGITVKTRINEDEKVEEKREEFVKQLASNVLDKNLALKHYNELLSNNTRRD